MTPGDRTGCQYVRAAMVAPEVGKIPNFAPLPDRRSKRDRQDRRFLDHGHRHRGVDGLDVWQLGEVVEVERLVGLDVPGHHAQHEVPFAHRRVAVEHFGPLADRLGERCNCIASLAREFDVGKYGDVEAECSPIEQCDAPLDDARLLEGLNAASARGGRESGPRGNFSD